jgi:NADPH2:quinone reductase
LRAIQADRLDNLNDYAEVEIDLPQPKAEELRIKIAAVGIGYVDALLALGRYQVKPALPHIPGVDVAGTVDAIGEGVGCWRVGDRVMAMVTRGFAEYAIARAALTVKLSDAVSSEQGASRSTT